MAGLPDGLIGVAKAIELAIDEYEVEHAQQLLRRFSTDADENARTPAEMATDAKVVATWSSAAVTNDFRATLRQALLKSAWVHRSTAECAGVHADILRYIAEGLSEADAQAKALSEAQLEEVPASAPTYSPPAMSPPVYRPPTGTSSPATTSSGQRPV